MTLRQFPPLCRDVGVSFGKTSPSRLAAAISFYAICSFAPLVILAMMLLGSYTHDTSVVQQLTEPLRVLLGAENARALQRLLQEMGTNVGTTRATVFGCIGLLFSASGVFAEVQSALNTLWKAPAVEWTWRGYVWQRFLTIVVLVVSGLIMLMSMLLTSGLTFLSTSVSSSWAVWAESLKLAHGLVAFLVLAVLFSGLYWFLPDVQMRLTDVLLGGLVTTLLFTWGQAAMGWYLGRFGIASVYGPVSSVVAMLFWVYYSIQIFLFGAHFTYVYACQYGSLAPPQGSNLPPLKPAPREPSPPQTEGASSRPF